MVDVSNLIEFSEKKDQRTEMEFKINFCKPFQT